MMSSQAPGKPIYKWWIFTAVTITTIMATLDSSIVNIALPVIRADFQVEIVVVEWVVVSYLLTISSLLMIFGRIADLFGRKKVFMAGIIIFTLSSVMCAFAGSIYSLILSRSLQGIGGSCITANGLPIITSAFPSNERGKAIGWNGTTVAFGLSAGPIIGGLITHLFGWRSIFFVNLPIGIVALILAQKFLRESKAQRPVTFDFSGAALLAIALVSFLLAFTEYQNWGLTAFFALIAVFIIAIVAFVRQEKLFAHPMVDLNLFKENRFTNSSLAAFLNFAGRFSIIFLFPFYLVDLRGLNTSTAGLLMTPIPLLMAAIAPYCGSLSDRIGSRLLTTLGTLITAAGFLMIAFIRLHTSFAFILASFFLMGIGSGMFNPPNTSAIMGSVPHHRLGNAGAMASLVRNLGMIVGIAWSGALFHALCRTEDHFSDAQIVIPAFSIVMIISFVINLSAAYFSYTKREPAIIPHS